MSQYNKVYAPEDSAIVFTDYRLQMIWESLALRARQRVKPPSFRYCRKDDFSCRPIFRTVLFYIGLGSQDALMQRLKNRQIGWHNK